MQNYKIPRTEILKLYESSLNEVWKCNYISDFEFKSFVFNSRQHNLRHKKLFVLNN